MNETQRREAYPDLYESLNEYDNIPGYTLSAIRNYVIERRPVGHFLTAVLCNNLFEACFHADAANLAALPLIVKFIYNRVPSCCWGSKEKVFAWKTEQSASTPT